MTEEIEYSFEEAINELATDKNELKNRIFKRYAVRVDQMFINPGYAFTTEDQPFKPLIRVESPTMNDIPYGKKFEVSPEDFYFKWYIREFPKKHKKG